MNVKHSITDDWQFKALPWLHTPLVIWATWKVTWVKVSPFRSVFITDICTPTSSRKLISQCRTCAEDKHYKEELSWVTNGIHFSYIFITIHDNFHSEKCKTLWKFKISQKTSRGTMRVCGDMWWGYMIILGTMREDYQILMIWSPMRGTWRNG